MRIVGAAFRAKAPRFAPGGCHDENGWQLWTTFEFCFVEFRQFRPVRAVLRSRPDGPSKASLAGGAPDPAPIRLSGRRQSSGLAEPGQRHRIVAEAALERRQNLPWNRFSRGADWAPPSTFIGEIRDRTSTTRQFRIAGLNLLAAIITY